MRGLRTGAVALAFVLGSCSADPTPTVSPAASASGSPAQTPAPSASAEPPASASASAAPTPFPVRDSAEADALFDDPDTCTNPEIGYTVTFPDDWYTNTEIGDQAACAWFTPDFFEVDVPGEMPDEIWISIELVEGIIGYTMLSPTIAGEDVEIDGHEARWAEYLLLEEIGAESDDLNYHYVIPLDRAGPSIVASTDVERADDYELAKAVLDRIMASMDLNPAAADVPTIPDEPTGPPLTGDPVTDEDADASFRLTLQADQDRYRAGQVIEVIATLTYLGPADAVVARGSSNPGLIGFSVESDAPAIQVSPAFTTDCGAHEMTRDVAVEYPLAKSGGFSPDEPLTPFYEAYFESEELRLPAGTWTIGAGGGWYVGDCGSGEMHSLSASVTVQVEP